MSNSQLLLPVRMASFIALRAVPIAGLSLGGLTALSCTGDDSSQENALADGGDDRDGGVRPDGDGGIDPDGGRPPPADAGTTPDAGPIIGTGNITIEDMGLHEIPHGDVFSYDPIITGDVILCRKDMGPDDAYVDPVNGSIYWDTSGLIFGRGVHIRIKCSNYDGHVFSSMVVHVDKSGSSRLRVAGQDGVSPYIGVAGRAMASGDTIVFPDGIYPVSVSGNESYENAFKSNSPTAGSSEQFSTIIAETPGGVTITGAAHDGIPQQKNSFQLLSPSNIAIVGFVSKNVLRESFTAGGLGANDRVLLDFVGTAGAGTNNEPCGNFQEAANGWCSQAGMRVNGGQPLIQNSYDWGHNRYGIMTRSSTGSLTRRSFVRLDEHKGDQPYGGFSNYCDTAHTSQDNTIFDSLAIAAPHYKNYAGLETYPATGCEQTPSTLKSEGLLAVNNKLSLSLMDSKAGPATIWDHTVSYDNEGTCTPQTNRCGAWLLQADKPVDVSNSVFGKSRAFEGGTSGPAFLGNDMTLPASSVSIFDVPGRADQGTAPRYLPESLLYHRGRLDTFHGDPGASQLTNSRRYPIAGEDIIATNMRSFHNPSALRVGGGTIDVDGDRGATASGESISEYLWGYMGELVPPLVVRIKIVGDNNRIGWERHVGSRRELVTGWKVICTSDGDREVASVNENVLAYVDDSDCTSYGVQAVYAAGTSGIAYSEAVQ